MVNWFMLLAVWLFFGFWAIVLGAWEHPPKKIDKVISVLLWATFSTSTFLVFFGFI
jgi:hypothetical protein